MLDNERHYINLLEPLPAMNTPLNATHRHIRSGSLYKQQEDHLLFWSPKKGTWKRSIHSIKYLNDSNKYLRLSK